MITCRAPKVSGSAIAAQREYTNSPSCEALGGQARSKTSCLLGLQKIGGDSVKRWAVRKVRWSRGDGGVMGGFLNLAYVVNA
jgi:hypothetical protein